MEVQSDCRTEGTGERHRKLLEKWQIQHTNQAQCCQQQLPGQHSRWRVPSAPLLSQPSPASVGNAGLAWQTNGRAGKDMLVLRVKRDKMHILGEHIFGDSKRESAPCSCCCGVWKEENILVISALLIMLFHLYSTAQVHYMLGNVKKSRASLGTECMQSSTNDLSQCFWTWQPDGTKTLQVVSCKQGLRYSGTILSFTRNIQRNTVPLSREKNPFILDIQKALKGFLHFSQMKGSSWRGDLFLGLPIVFTATLAT